MDQPVPRTSSAKKDYVRAVGTDGPYSLGGGDAAASTVRRDYPADFFFYFATLLRTTPIRCGERSDSDRKRSPCDCSRFGLSATVLRPGTLRLITHTLRGRPSDRAAGGPQLVGARHHTVLLLRVALAVESGLDRCVTLRYSRRIRSVGAIWTSGGGFLHIRPPGRAAGGISGGGTGLLSGWRSDR
jgi:hypothetical protein